MKIRASGVYPNPVNDVTSINNIEIGSILEISDIVGNDIMKLKPMQSEISIDISHLQPGIYFLNSPNRSTVKIIKL